jgi:glycerol kinase
MTVFLTIDQGTTGTTIALIRDDLRILGEYSEDFPQHFPKPGWVEHDLEDIWNTVLRGIESLAKSHGEAFSKISAIGITNQRETVGFWEHETRKPLARALVWQDRRTGSRCEELRRILPDLKLQQITGLLWDPYFSGTKIEWMLRENSEVKRASDRGELRIGTMDTFVLSRLTQGASHLAEATNASRTLLMDLEKQEWHPEMLKLLQVPSHSLGEIRSSFGDFGRTKGVPGLPDGIPITGILGDQHAALLGQACTSPGMGKCTYGTGAFLVLNTGATRRASQHRLLTTLAWMHGNRATFALEGSTFVAGSAVQWLRDGLGIIQTSQEVETLAQSIPSSDGVIFVPALTGLGAPHWNPLARGLISGLTRGTTRAHLARATLEGIAHQVSDLMEAMGQDLGEDLRTIRVDGGAAANNLLMQFQADFSGVTIERALQLESTSIGAAIAAGIGVGRWSSVEEVGALWKPGIIFSPSMPAQERGKIRFLWNEATKRA